jgi:mRNA-degrading endonuclease toxin of MazEF toxin-antitoxin module
MAALGSQTIASSYEQLLHVDADGGGNGNTLVNVKDGDNGTTFGIKLSTNKVEVIPSAADDANAFEVSKNDGTAVLTVNTSTVGATLIGALTVGADDLGHDVIFYGDTASSNMTWDTSEDDLVLNDARLYINQDDNVGSVLINSEASTAQTFYIDTPANTTGNAIIAHSCDSLTTGSIAYFHSDSSTTNTRGLVKIINDNTSATGATGLQIQQDAAAYGMFIDQNGNYTALAIDTEATSGYGLIIDDPAITTGTCLRVHDAVALTTGKIAHFYSNSSDTGTRNLVEINNDHTSATGATPLLIQQDAANQAVKIDQNGNGDGLVVSTDATTRHGVYVDGSSFTTGSALKVYSNSSSTSSRNLVDITNDNVNATGATCLKIQQDASYYGIDIDHNNNSTALNVDGTATTENIVSIAGHSLTTGGLLKVRSDTGNTDTRTLVNIVNDHADSTGTTALRVDQDAAQTAVHIEIDANAKALSINTEGTTSEGLQVVADSLTTGPACKIYSDSSSVNARNILDVRNDHSSADSAVTMFAKQSGNAHCIQVEAMDASYSSNVVLLNAYGRSANSGFEFLVTYTDGDNDIQHNLRGDGAVFADGAYDGSGADYAEYFESKDGKAIAVGTTVKLDGDKIVACEDGDTPMGVARPNGNSVVIGNSASLKWTGKYLKDDYGAYIMEEYTVTEWMEYTDEIKKEAVLYVEEDEIPEGKKVGDIKESAKYFKNDIQYWTDEIPSDVTVPSDATVTSTEKDGSKLMRRKKNPDYDESKTYSPREERDEWCLVGLLGQIPITKGQPVASNWIKMKDVSDTVEMYFVK